MGGKAKLEAALDSLFAKNEYWHGNEPGHQIPFMYDYTGAPWKTQQQVRRILEQEYGDGPGGLSGNDDAGQMSAWYVFAAMGFYPLNPVSSEYMLSSPIFDTVTITLPARKVFTVISKRKSAAAAYSSGFTLNGRLLRDHYIRYTDIMQGGTLECDFSAQPGRR